MGRRFLIMPLWICLRWPEAASAEHASAQLQRLALAMLRYSPKVACFRHDSVVLEVAASLKLFGGVLSLCRHIRSTARTVLTPLQLGMAPSASGAWLLAGSPEPRCRRVLRKTSLVRHLAGLPLQHLPETRPHQEWLENIACRSLGDLHQLPRQGLQQRSSPALLHALDAAYAQSQETITWFQAPARFRLACELDFHLQQTNALLAVTQPLLLALCGWLQNRQEALHDLSLLLHHEKGRDPCPPSVVALRFSAATWRAEDFNRVLKEQLQHVALKRPAIRLELIAGLSHPRAPASETLFPDPTQHFQEEQRLLDLLSARLGKGGIRRPRPRAHHLPEQANIWASLTTAPVSASLPVSLGANPRPFWLMEAPHPLATHHERPVHQGRPLRLVQGPERIETGWYEGSHHRRDYFVAEDPDGARYWVFRERETGDGWFLHGLFA